MMGCVGYAGMAAVAGWVAQRNPADTFWLYAATALLTMLVLLWVPRSHGSRARGRANPFLLFRNPLLLRYTFFAIAFLVTRSYFMNFFSVYFTGELGGSARLYGLLTSVAALTEIPLIFLLDRIIERFGTRRVMLLAGCVETLRWLMTALVRNPQIQLLGHAVLGANNMVLSLTMVLFVNRLLPPEQKAAGQATYVMVTSVASMVLGNLGGGALAGYIGMRPVFFLSVLINGVTLLLLLREGRRDEAATQKKSL